MLFKDFSIKERPKKVRNIACICALFGVLLVGFLFILSNINLDEDNIDYASRFDVLSEDWTIIVNDQIVKGDLPLWVDINPNDKAELIRRIDDVEPNYAFVTRNYHNKLSVYCNNDQIYSFPDDKQPMSGTIITDDWNMIHIPADKDDNTVRVVFEAGGTGYSGYILPLYFGEDNSIWANIRQQFVPSYVLALVVALLGGMLVLVDSVFSRNYEDKSHILLGFVFVAVGMWFANRSRMPIFAVGSNVKFFLAFTGLIIVPLLLVLYAGDRFKSHDQTFINILSIIDTALMVILFVYIALSNTPINAILPIVYFAILISCIYLGYLMWYYAHGPGKNGLGRVERNSVRIEFIAAIITLIGSFISIAWDAMSTNNFSLIKRDWSGVGNIQMLSVIVFGLFHLIVLLYRGYYGVLESEEIQKKLHTSQLQLMMGQIQPHFTFNTLSSIRTLIKIDPEMAYNMTYNFSNYLRANVDNITNLDGIRFAAEVKHIESYVGIEEVRFGDRLRVEYDIRETDFIVPPLSIQPLVENAIKHGVVKKLEGGTVWLRSYANEKGFIVEVEDNGVGIPQEKIDAILHGKNDIHDDSDMPNLTGNGSEDHKSTGMRNIILRLQELSGATMEITSEVDKGTLTKITFPRIGKNKDL